MRAIALLAVADFASQAQVRVMDSLLPQIAADLHTTVGLAAMVVTAYAVTHGSVQLVIGPLADRFGKYRTVALTCALGAVLVAICGTVSSLPQLALARLATGAAAGWVIPISMAYVGDVAPPERLQQILGRFISGQILGQLFGQAAGGVLGDLLGWRNVFFVLAGLFALSAFGLVAELAVNPQTRTSGAHSAKGFIGDYAAVLFNPFARVVIAAGFIEGALAWGRVRLYRRLPSPRLRPELLAGRWHRRLFRHRRTSLRRTGQAVRLSARPNRACRWRRDHSCGRLYRARHRFGLVAGTDSDDSHRARLLHAAQHAPNQRHANDAASARHGSRLILLGALHRADRGRGDWRDCHRPRRRAAAVSRDRHRPPGARPLVCA
ncbi:MAG: MFS transporter [Xanthobacteraceae bacterium]